MVTHVKRDRLLRTQTPVIAEAFIQIRRAERPEGCVPAGAFALRFVRSRGDVPALHHFANEAGFLQALAIGAGKLAGANCDGASVLKSLQGRKRVSELFGRRGHERIAKSRLSCLIISRLFGIAISRLSCLNARLASYKQQVTRTKRRQIEGCQGRESSRAAGGPLPRSRRISRQLPRALRAVRQARAPSYRRWLTMSARDCYVSDSPRMSSLRITRDVARNSARVEATSSGGRVK